MPAANGYLRKKRSSLMVVFSSNANYLVFASREPRTKALKKRRVFVGRIAFHRNGKDYNFVMKKIREWYETIDDAQLLERLENAPIGNLPLIQFDRDILIDFNSKTADIVRELLEDEPIFDL